MTIIKNKFKMIVEKYSKMPVQVKASFWFLICLVLQKGISIITTPIFTRIITQGEYGRFSVFISWESIITIIVSLNLSYGVFSQGLVKYDKDRLNFTSSMHGLTIFLVSVWTIIYLIFHTTINNILNMPTIYIVLMLLTIWLNAIFQFWASEQRVDYKYKKLIIITIIYSLLCPILGIVLIQFLEDNVLARILGIAISSFVLYFGLFISQIIKRKALYSKFYWSKALLFNIPLIPHYLSQTILNSSDRIMIERMINSSSSGIYSLAYSISLIMTIFNTALMQTISPWIYKKIKKQEINDIGKIAFASLIVIAVVNLLLIIMAPEAVAIFAPKEYHEAIYVIPPVAMSVYFMYLYDLFAKFEFYYEKTKTISIATVIGAITNIFLNYYCIKKYGYMAAGYTTLICYMLYALFHYFAMRKVCRDNCNRVYPYDEKKIIITTFIFLCLGLSCILLYKNILLRYTFILLFIIILILKRKLIINYINEILLVKKDKLIKKECD